MGGSTALRFGRYELVERIAIGGMAELYRARLDGAHDFHKPVAIKKILPHLSADPSFVSMFIDEAKITAQLTHPKIVQVFDLGTTGGELFIAMEYVEGIDLLKLLRYHARRGRRLPPQIAAHIAHETLDALDHAHAALDDRGEPLSVVHRDVSPGNILLSSRGVVKLTDFGIARAAERNQKTEAGTLKGKYGYMSPEQVVNAEVDGRSDIFAVGVVLAEMLMGKRLFVAPSDLDVLLMVRDVNLERLIRFGSHIDPQLFDLIQQALHADLDARIQTAAEFRDRLGDWLFEGRHRVAPRDVARLVAEVRADGMGLESGAVGTPVASAPRKARSEGVTRPLDPDPAPKAEADAKPARLRPRTELPEPEVSISWRDAEPGEAPYGSKVEPLDALGSSRLADPGTFGLGDASDLLGPDEESISLGDPGSSLELMDEAPSELTLIDPGSGIMEVDSSSALEDPGSGISALRTPGSHLELGDPSRSERLDGWCEVEDLELASPADEDLLDEPASQTIAEARPRRKGASSSPSAALERAASAAGDGDDEAIVFAGLEPLGPCPQRGELGPISAPALLANLVRRRATGRLALVLEPTHKEIYFIDGMPKFVSSNVASERLGEFLLRRGEISSGELSMALSMLPQFDNRLIGALVGLGLMDDSRALHCLTQQVRAKLVDACSWEKGSYRFYEGDEIPYSWLPLPLDPYEILGAAALGTTREFIDGWARWREEKVPRIVKPQPIPIDYFRIASEIRDVLSYLDGRKVLGEIHGEFENPRAWHRFCQILFLLTATGAVRLMQP